MPKHVFTEVIGNDLGNTVPANTPMPKGGSRPKGMKQLDKRDRYLVVGSAARMDVNTKFDSLGDTKKELGRVPKVSESGMIDFNKR